MYRLKIILLIQEPEHEFDFSVDESPWTKLLGDIPWCDNLVVDVKKVLLDILRGSIADSWMIAIGEIGQQVRFTSYIQHVSR
jgi:hypothetical protein